MFLHHSCGNNNPSLCILCIYNLFTYYLWSVLYERNSINTFWNNVLMHNHFPKRRNLIMMQGKCNEQNTVHFLYVKYIFNTQSCIGVIKIFWAPFLKEDFSIRRSSGKSAFAKMKVETCSQHFFARICMVSQHETSC